VELCLVGVFFNNSRDYFINIGHANNYLFFLCGKEKSALNGITNTIKDAIAFNHTYNVLSFVSGRPQKQFFSQYYIPKKAFVNPEMALSQWFFAKTLNFLHFNLAIH
jgi:hypothetical protein